MIQLVIHPLYSGYLHHLRLVPMVYHPPGTIPYQVSLSSTTMLQHQPRAAYNIQHTITSELVTSAFFLPVSFSVLDLIISRVSNKIKKTNGIKLKIQYT
jgi:hypothetical protein